MQVPYLPATLKGLRILHLTDLHLRPRWSRAYDDLHQRLGQNPPDLICITGDFVDCKLDHRKALPTLQRFVSGLRSRIGIFAITGNHDGDLLGPRLGALGVHFISGRLTRLSCHDSAVELIGMSGVKRRDFDPDFLESTPAREAGVPRIILGHYPDQIRFIEPAAADALLVGHTHGGQICLPGGKALVTHDDLPKCYARGAHRFGCTTLIVNRGFGMTSWPLRAFCPAEVVEIELV